jgi:threonine/homoserine/homoserine lactone efflux protein
LLVCVGVFLKAVLAGFVVAMPIGAVGALCLRCALQGRIVIGLITGFGAAVADSVLAAAALFGLSLVSDYLAQNRDLIRLVGGLFLLYLGGQMIWKREEVPTPDTGAESTYLRRLWNLTGAFATGFALTIFNPATLIAFVGVMAGFGLFANRPDSSLGNALVLAGVMAGSMLWWTALTGGSHLLSDRIPRKLASTIHTVLGLIVIGFGAASLFSLLQKAG